MLALGVLPDPRSSLCLDKVLSSDYHRRLYFLAIKHNKCLKFRWLLKIQSWMIKVHTTLLHSFLHSSENTATTSIQGLTILLPLGNHIYSFELIHWACIALLSQRVDASRHSLQADLRCGLEKEVTTDTRSSPACELHPCIIIMSSDIYCMTLDRSLQKRGIKCH